jgi:hypothetical protein
MRYFKFNHLCTSFNVNSSALNSEKMFEQKSIFISIEEGFQDSFCFIQLLNFYKVIGLIRYILI